MKIGIDCRMLSSKFGLGRYVQQLVKYLQKIDTENQYVLFLRKENFNEIDTEGMGRDLSVHNNFKRVLADIPWYSFAEQIKFKKIIRKEKVDLMHFPHFNVPYFYNNPFVVTIHDLTMFHYPRPEATTRSKIIFWLKDKVHRLVIKHAIKKAKHIIATSEFTKGDVVKTLCVPEKKVTVTYQAPFSDGNWKLEIGNWGELKSKYDIKRPYVLYVGAAYPHKNLKKLIEAWKIFEEKYSGDYQLVLVGKENYFYLRLRSTINDQRSIIFTDFVEDNELVELYKNASLYVFPSLSEGFGLPSLEAMSHGVPVISSNASCLPEILGDATIYFDPNSAEQMAEVMQKVLNNEDLQLELKQNARENLRRFSWKKLVQKTVKIYKNVNK